MMRRAHHGPRRRATVAAAWFYLLLGFTPAAAAITPSIDIVFAGAGGGDAAKESRFTVEVADTPASRERGLMFRRSLQADRGMLFVFDNEAPRQFWMKNTFIALDMLFLSSERKVIGIVAEATPQTLTGRGVPIPSRYVVELLGGTAARAHIQVGAQATFISQARRIP
jgi:uncharacterized membrane protein (UPF0127 family)